MNTEKPLNLIEYGSDPTVGSDQEPHEFYYPIDTPKNSFIERWLRILRIAVIIVLVGWEMWK